MLCPNISILSDGDIVWHTNEKCAGKMNEDSPQQSLLIPEKKRTRNIGSKNKRLLMHSEDALELKITWQETQDILRPPPSVEPNIVTIEGYEIEEYTVSNTQSEDVYLFLIYY